MSRIKPYARFSPRPSAEECESCDNQLSEIAEWIARNGHKNAAPIAAGSEWPGYRDDNTHGDPEDRPALEALVKELRRGEIVVVRDFDRVSRVASHRLGVAAQIAAKGARLVSLREGEYRPNDPATKLLFGIMANVGEFNRDNIKIATSKGMLRNIYRDNRVQGSKQPFGWEVDPDSPLVVYPNGKHGGPSKMRRIEAEQVVIARIVAMYRDEGKSLGAITLALMGENVPCRGSKWYKSTVRDILIREGVELRKAGRPIEMA